MAQHLRGELARGRFDVEPVPGSRRMERMLQFEREAVQYGILDGVRA